ncbi:MAG: hypothetical protein EHM20_00020 [Alphaproteobacteria bacterium]|nr:MAG: hypothetical protein EHM20_00020 [Alphaproteobacteria bacterium]
MYVYHDYKYVEHILNSDADKGLLLYIKCIDRMNEKIMIDEDNKLWQAFIHSGSEGQTFDDYKASIGYRNNEPGIKNKNSMSRYEKNKEETRIIKNSSELRKIIEAKDKEFELNKIAQLSEG